MSSTSRRGRPGCWSTGVSSGPSRRIADFPLANYVFFGDGTRFDGNTTQIKSIRYQSTNLLAGDCNLDGRVDHDDYALIDRGHAGHLAGWGNGDFNGDDVVGQQDYLVMDQAFLSGGGASDGALLAAREGEFGADYVQTLLLSVPEPSLGGGVLSLVVFMTERKTMRARGKARVSAYAAAFEEERG